jgi:hypothetical protein
MAVMISGADIPAEELAVEADDPAAELSRNPDIGSEPETSDMPGVPTFDDLASKAAAGMSGPDPTQMMQGANQNLQGGIEYRGMQPAEKILLFRSTTGEAVPCTLYFNAGRTVHDWGRHYRAKRYGFNDPTIPAELWGKNIFLPRKPLNPPLAVKANIPKCEFCIKEGFPSELERRRHMQMKHKNEYAEGQRERTETDQAEDRSLLRGLLQANTDAVSVLLNPEGRQATDAENRIAGKLAAEVADADADSAENIGMYRSLKDAMEFYRLGRTKMITLVESGDYAGHKDEQGQWRIFIPSKTWQSTAEKAEAEKQETVSIS